MKTAARHRVKLKSPFIDILTVSHQDDNCQYLSHDPHEVVNERTNGMQPPWYIWATLFLKYPPKGDASPISNVISNKLLEFDVHMQYPYKQNHSALQLGQLRGRVSKRKKWRKIRRKRITIPHNPCPPFSWSFQSEGLIAYLIIAVVAAAMDKGRDG